MQVPTETEPISFLNQDVLTESAYSKTLNQMASSRVHVASCLRLRRTADFNLALVPTSIPCMGRSSSQAAQPLTIAHAKP